MIYTYNNPDGDLNDYNDIVYETKINVKQRPVILQVDTAAKS